MKKTYSIGIFTAIAIVAANQIGTGVFTSIGFQVFDITSGFSLAFLWFLGGLVALSGAFAYGELSAAMPRSGGEYHLLSEIYHPIVGFTSGWISIAVGFTAPIAAASMAMGAYGSSVLVSLNSILPESKDFASQIIAVSAVSIVTLVHLLKDKIVSTFQVFFTALKIILILALIIFGFSITQTPTNISFLPTSQSFTEILSAPFAVSLIYVMYAYSGWNSATYIAGEIKNPERNLPLSLFFGTLIVIVLYVPINAVFLYTAEIEQLKGQVDVGIISAQNIFGNTGGIIMGLLISIGLISAISSMIWAGPRVTQVMGEDTKLLNFMAIKNQNGVPAYSLLVQYALILFFIFTSTFENVITYIGFILTISSLLTVLGVFVMRYKKPQMPRPYKTWGFPITPLFFSVVMIWMLYYLIKERPEQAIWGMITILSGILVYALNQFLYKKN
jgi:APA family basic amino acid/polyamine antiporter